MKYRDIESFKTECIASVVKSQAWNLLRLIFEPTDIVEFRKLPSRRSVWAEASLEDINTVRGLCQSNFKGQDIFFGVNPRGTEGGRKLADVPLCRSLMASFSEHYSVARGNWEGAGLPFPTAVVKHEGGCVLFGRLEEPVTIEEWKVLQKCLISVTGCAPLCDATRVVHMPGFYWHANGDVSRTAEFKFDSRISASSLRQMVAFKEALASE